jgi:hypothetical protein
MTDITGMPLQNGKWEKKTKQITPSPNQKIQ